MPPKQKQPDKKLLENLEGLNDAQLKRSVEQSENLKSPVETVHGTRKMQCYSVTESELLQLSIVNTAVAFAWSFSAGLAVFLVDIVKDIMLSDDIPQKAQDIGVVVIPILFFALIISVWAALKAQKWRKRLIDLIKQESSLSKLVETKSVGWKLQWPISKQ